MEIFPEISSDKTMQIDMGEQLAVLNSWNTLEHHLEQQDRDPTSPFGGKM